MMRYTVAFYVASVPISQDVRDGRASLGGSESACFGLARALAAAGHDVHVLAQRLAEDATGKDGWGVTWHDAGAQDAAVYEWCDVVEPDVFVSLRMAHIFAHPVRARLRCLWNQDLLVGEQGAAAVMATSWQVDRYIYVSDYHRQQWEDVCPDLRGLAIVTRNGFDPAHVPAAISRVPGRICYVTRPERALAPLLQMWPALKAAVPHAELHITRYASMYDGEGGAVKAMCESFDRLTAQVQEAVGGITVYPGGLGKAALYDLIASSEIMWYPGVADFAETSCVAAVEAQACGTVFVGSAKGALPETVPNGVLLAGDASTPEYQARAVGRVSRLLGASGRDEAEGRIAAGRAHVTGYSYAAIASDWADWIFLAFDARVAANPAGVLRQLLQYDDHCAAALVAEAFPDVALPLRAHDGPWAGTVREFCAHVINGKDQTSDDYGTRSEQDVRKEIASDGRITEAIGRFIGKRRVLDVACGNGSFAIGLALRDPAVRVLGIDYSADNITRATAAAHKLGVGDRVTFETGTIYDFASHDVTLDFEARVQGDAEGFDGAFIGEFLEHVANVAAVVDVITQAVDSGGLVVATMPSGPFTELMPANIPIKRGHVHHFAYDDLVQVFGAQTNVQIGVLQIGHTTPRGNPVAHWIVSFEASTGLRARDRDYTKRCLTTRPMPTLTAGLIVGPGCALDLPRCLDTVYKAADQVVVGLTGFDDPKIDAICAEYGAEVLRLPAIVDLPGGFAEARNRVLDVATCDWFLWIDADEQLVGSAALRKYLDAHLMHGYVLRQNHLQLDAAMFYDTPVRLFRRGVAQFYGAVHEQPQRIDNGNADIWPSLAVTDVQIAHYGYLTDAIRRRKSQGRNLTLLVRDRIAFPDRRLSRVLWMREFATWLSEIGLHRSTYLDALTAISREIGTEAVSSLVFDGAPVPNSGMALARTAAAYYEAHFPDPADRLAGLARPFYEACLRILPEAFEVPFTFAARQGGMQGGVAKPSPFWTRSEADCLAVVHMHTAKIAKVFHPAPIKTDPFPAPDVAALIDAPEAVSA